MSNRREGDEPLSFTSDQSIECTNTKCPVEYFRLQVSLDISPNGRQIVWSVGGAGTPNINPACPSCGMTHHRGWVRARPAGWVGA
jgi:hypothetical protein